MKALSEIVFRFSCAEIRRDPVFDLKGDMETAGTVVLCRVLLTLRDLSNVDVPTALSMNEEKTDEGPLGYSHM